MTAGLATAGDQESAWSWSHGWVLNHLQPKFQLPAAPFTAAAGAPGMNQGHNPRRWNPGLFRYELSKARH